MANEKSLGLAASVVNGVDQGGEMSIAIEKGFDLISRSAPDGRQVAVADRQSLYVRGTGVTQAWQAIIDLLTGEVDEYVFYERKSGVAEATGYIKHTLKNPVIWDVQMAWRQGGYGTVTFRFECRFADASDTTADVHVKTDAQGPPTLNDSLELGGFRVVSAKLGALTIQGVSAFEFRLALALARASTDGWAGYGNVDAEIAGGSSPSGSITFQDAALSGGADIEDRLLAAARGSLELTCRMSGGADNKIVTLAGVLFTGFSHRKSGDRNQYAESVGSFVVGNLLATPLTLSGANKILTIADEK